MSRRLTTTDLIAEVRSLTDELNNESLSNDDILGALNRSQIMAASILRRVYHQPLLKFVDIATPASGAFQIPDDALSGSIKKVEALVNQLPIPMSAISEQFSHLYEYAPGQGAQYSTHYQILGNEIRFLPKPNGPDGGYRIWYLQRPSPLAVPQGQIATVNLVNNSFILTDTISEISQNQSSNLSYISIYDGETGVYKNTYQVQSFINGRVTVRVTPVKTTVFGLEVTTGGLDVNNPPTSDDLISFAGSSPVPVFKDDVGQFIIQHAFFQCAAKLGGEVAAASKLASEFERDLKATHAGRQNSVKVGLSSRNWGGTNTGPAVRRPYSSR
jgi:hypothetical protein